MTDLRGEIKTTANSGFKKLAVQWLNEHLFFVSSVALADSLCSEIANFLNPQTVVPNAKK